MFKKTLQIALTVALLVGGYAGYRRGFAVVARRFGPPRVVPIVATGLPRSDTARQTDALAARAFGADHWAARADGNSFRYYSIERGYWMFAQNYTRSADGKRLTFTPFALIWLSKDRRALKTMAGREAVIDFDRPFDMEGKSGEARVIHAQINGDVRLRDDKGTEPAADDLTIGPMTYLEFDGLADQIRSTSPVVMRDRDMTATGVGLRIDLRPREGPARPGGVGASASGYNGARTAYLLRDVHITVKDVGRGGSGIVPGVGGGDVTSAGAPRPGDIQCDGEMRIDLPRPRPTVQVGPPVASEPTLAHFNDNVRVRQGDPEHPDQLDGDHLHLTLLPAEDLPSTPEARAEAEAKRAAQPYLIGATVAPADDGVMTGLVLVRAEATGHAVWLQSPTRGVQAYGNQLIYERHAPIGPDMIYFRGDRYTDVEKVQLVAAGKDIGKVQSIDKIRTTDVTIYQRGNDPPTVVAQGRGTLESRPGKGLPVERSASWEDRLEMQTVPTKQGLRRRVTLFGKPSVQSATQGAIHARDKIIAFLKPKDAAPDAPTPPPGANDSLKIDRMEALGDVLLVMTKRAQGWKADDPAAPISKRIVRARRKLDAVFTEPDRPPALVADSRPVAPAEPGPDPIPAPADDAPAGPTPNADDVADAGPEARPGPEKKPAEPDLDAVADTVWAEIAMRPSGEKADARGDKSKGDVRVAYLRGDVAVHQDPEPGKLLGTDARGDAIDLTNSEDGKAVLHAQGRPERPAVLINDEMGIQGFDLHLDQAANHAWVNGPGRLTQRSNGGKLAVVKDDTPKAAGADRKPADTKGANSDKAKKADAKGQAVVAKAAEKEKKSDKEKADPGPMDITWDTYMHFYGMPTDERGQLDVAQADFVGNVHAETTESTVDCNRLVAFLDRPVPFVRERKPADPTAARTPEPKPQIVEAHCAGDVRIINRKLDVDGQLKEKQKVLGNYVIYDKPNGAFDVRGAGLVYHYSRAEDNRKAKPDGRASLAPTDARVLTVANPPRGRNVASNSNAGATNGRKPAAPPKPEKPPLELTRISFDSGMKGRFAGSELSYKATDTPTGARQADFAGNVRTLRAGVRDEDDDLDQDNPPDDYMLMTSQALHMATEPAPAGSKERAYTFLRALSDAQVTTIDKAVLGDEIHYSSANEMVYILGHDHGVRIVQQRGLGQPTTHARGSVVEYNLKSKDTRLIDGRNFLFVDGNTGSRAHPASPDKDPKVKKPQRPLYNPPRSDKEKRGFR